MPLISERIANFLGGVSQRADVQRDPSQGGRSINSLTHPAFGLMKRPPTRHGAVLSYIPTDWPGAYVYPIQTSFNERYRAIFTDGDLKIFNSLSGAEVPIDFEDGRAYLDTTSAAPNSAFRCVSIGNRTIVVNRNRTVQRATTLSPTQAPDALVVVVEANYSTSYNILLNNENIEFGTVGPTDASDRTLRTDYIAAELKREIEASNQGGNFTVTQYGSTLHIAKQVAGTFDIEVHDGLADNGLTLIHPSVDRAEQLPKSAPDGYVAQVIGQKSKTSDDTWYAFSVVDAMWQETAEPGTLVELLGSSMPHELVLNSSSLNDEQHSGDPQAPDVSTGGNGGVLTYPIFATTRDSATEITRLGPVTGHYFPLGFVYDIVYANLANAGASGGDVTFSCLFDVDSSGIAQGNGVTYTLSVSDHVTAGNWTVVASARYTQGDGVSNSQRLSATFDASTNYDVKLEVSYDTTPAQGQKAWAKIWLAASSQPSYAQYRVDNSTSVVFPTAGVYPQGVQQTILLEGVDSFDYTPSSDETGAEVAAGFASVIDADGSYTASAAGTSVTIIEDGVTDPPSAVWSTAFDNSTMYHGPGLTMTPSGIVGSTLNNLTDGSTGTVTANTSTTITVDDLTGGVDDKFDKYDSIEVSSLAESFIFREVDWTDRNAGSLETNPFPSFTDARITAAFYHRGRLGLCAGSNISMTAAGEYKNWFRTSVNSLIDSDRIDIKAETQKTGTFFAGVSVGDQQLLFTDAGQYEITSGPLLTPASVGIRQVTSYLAAPQCDPTPLGRQVAFAFDRYGHVQLQLYGLLPEATRTFNADDITRDVPRMLEGNVRQIVGFTDSNLLVVLTDTEGGVGLPGLTSDPYLDPTAQVIPPQPPPAPPALPPVDGNDIGLAGQAEQELFTEVEISVDTTVLDTESKADTDALGSITDAQAQATEGPLPDTVLATQTDAASMVEVEGIEDIDLAGDEVKSDNDVITEDDSSSYFVDGYTSAILVQTASVQSNLMLCTSCVPQKFYNTRATSQFIISGASSVRERIYALSQTGTLKHTRTYNMSPDNTGWIFGSYWGTTEGSEGLFTYWVELTPYLGTDLTGLKGPSVWMSASLLNIV